MKNLYLCGFMGAGKTTLSRLAAARLGTRALDTDDLVIQRCGMEIPAIFAEYGEPYFRQQETAALRETARFSGAVIATGGGLVLNPDNVAVIRELGTLLYLDTPFALCYQRIRGDRNRPNAASRTQEELLELYRQREAAYRAACDAVIPCGDDPDSAVEAILRFCDGK